MGSAAPQLELPRPALSEPPPRGRWRAIRKGLSFALFVLVVGFVALETQLRVINVPGSVLGVIRDFRIADTRLGWRGRPNVRLRFRENAFDVVIEHDDEGFRRPDPAPPANASRNLLFLGDSLLWGWGVAQGEVLTDVLQRDLAPNVAVYNRAVSTYGTGQELILLEQLLERRDYDAVVLIYSRTDPSDNLEQNFRRRPVFAMVDGKLSQLNSALPGEDAGYRLMHWMRDHSLAFCFLDTEVRRVQQWLYPTRTPQDWREYAASFTGGPRKLPGYELTRELLRAMSERARARGARFIIAYQPTFAFPDEAGEVAPRAARALIETACADTGIPFVDLEAGFVGTRDELTFAGDGHWTARGHLLVAESLRRSPIFQAAVEGAGGAPTRSPRGDLSDATPPRA